MRYAATIVTVIGALASVVHGPGQLFAQEITVDDVVRMWSERQSKTETATFRWRETVARPHDPPGPRRASQSGDTMEVDGQRASLDQAPAAEVHEATLRLGDNLSIRSESIPAQNLEESADPLTRPGLSASAFNGKRNVYYTAAVGPDDHHRGIEFDADDYDEIANYHLRAVLLCYRPLLVVKSHFSHQGGQIVRHDANLRIDSRDAIFDGNRCLVLKSAPNQRITNLYWVDIARDGLILRQVEIASGQTTSELTINYENHDQHGWIPTTWRASYLSGKSRVDAKLLDFAINEPMAASAFEIDYPTGTVVFDRDRRKQWRILSDGTRELITP